LGNFDWALNKGEVAKLFLHRNCDVTQKRPESYNRMSTDTCTQSTRRYHFQWPWVTPFSNVQHFSKLNILVPT